MKATKQLLVICILFFSGINSVFASDNKSGDTSNKFATHNDIYFSDNKLVASFYGSLGAVSGEVIERKSGPEKRPLVKLKLSKIDKTIWVATTVDVTENQLKVGEKIDVLGFFDETKNETEFVSKVTDDNAYLLGFCYRVLPIGEPIYNPHLLKRCLDWETGGLDLKVPHDSIQK